MRRDHARRPARDEVVDAPQRRRDRQQRVGQAKLARVGGGRGGADAGHRRIVDGAGLGAAGRRRCNAARRAAPVGDERERRALRHPLDRGRGLRPVAALRPRRGRHPAGDRPRRAQPRQFGRSRGLDRDAARHRLAAHQHPGVGHHDALRRALGDRRRGPVGGAGHAAVRGDRQPLDVRCRHLHGRDVDVGLRPGAAELPHRGRADPLPGARACRRSAA